MVKRTGPTSKNTKTLAIDLGKHAMQSKHAIYGVLSEALLSSTRTRAEINLHRLEQLATLHKGKILVVPGKILATGEITLPVEVAAFRYSASAKNKITAAKGKILSLQQLIEQKIPANKLVLVK